MSKDILIVLSIFLFFIVAVLSNKVKIHVAAMAIPILLEVTQVLTFKEAWGGLTNSSIIMMASMFVVGEAIGETSLLTKFSKTFIKPGANDYQIMFGIAIPILFLGCFVNGTAIMVIMIPLIISICAEHQRPLSKFMYPSAALAQLWAGFLPTGGNAGSYLANNTIVEELGGTPNWTLFTQTVARAPQVLILIVIICTLTVKMSPDKGNIPTAKFTTTNQETHPTMSAGKERLVVVTFIVTIIGIISCALLKIPTWYPSTIAALLLVCAGAISDRDAIKAMTSPVIFITIGTLPLATALNKTGADTLIADTFNIVTGHMSPFMIMVFMYLLCMVLTQLITNYAVSNAFKTLAALIAIQNGFDARALMLCTLEGSSTAYLTPIAAPAMMMGSESGGYTMKEHFRLGLPLTIVRTLITIIYLPMIYPLV